MTDKPINLAARRFNSGDRDPSKHSPRAAAEAFIAAIDAGEIEPTHVIIAYDAPVKDRESGSRVGWFQAGKACDSAQIGILHRVIAYMIGDGS